MNISSKKSLYFNELARFGQFIEYTLFRSPFLLPKVPIWSPFHSKSGPHFEKFRSPSHVGAVTLILSVFSYIVFIWLYFHIDVFCISISVSFCCFLIFCIFRFLYLLYMAPEIVCYCELRLKKKHPT